LQNVGYRKLQVLYSVLETVIHSSNTTGPQNKSYRPIVVVLTVQRK